MNKKIDIIILTVNRSDKILRQLQSFFLQTVLPNKIIIMNTLNVDEKSKLCDVYKDFSDLNIEEYIVYKKDFLHGKTRNVGARYSNADYIIFMTDDAIAFDNKLIENLEKGISDGINDNVVMSYAKQIAYNEARFTEKKTREFNYGDKDIIKNKNTESIYGIKNYFASNVCCIYKKDIFDNVGGFDDEAKFNEDELYAYKVISKGYSVLYNSKAKVYHSHNFSFMEQYNRNKLVGLSQSINNNIFNNLKSEGEGLKLIKYVTIECIKNFKIIELIRFYVECIYRYKGYKDGKKCKS